VKCRSKHWIMAGRRKDGPDRCWPPNVCHCCEYPPNLCQCCLSIGIPGFPETQRLPTPAAYRWTGPHGNVTMLCASCCACWRENARDDPSLLPRRIETAIPPG
jgi:hypothetical protein